MQPACRSHSSYVTQSADPQQRPTQAVILAGGRGTRLRPMTDTRPKPMVEICGKPFLEYQIEQLREQGFERVLLLLGYLPEVVRDYFGDGRRWGMQDRVLGDGGGRRNRQARQARRAAIRSVLSAPVLRQLLADAIGRACGSAFDASGAPAMITVYSNKDGYTRNSVRVEADGMVSIYDKSCGRSGSRTASRSATRSSSKDVVRRLRTARTACSRPRSIRHLVAREAVGRVTSPITATTASARSQRLPLTEEFFCARKTVILDRDGVLNRRPPSALSTYGAGRSSSGCRGRRRPCGCCRSRLSGRGRVQSGGHRARRHDARRISTAIHRRHERRKPRRRAARSRRSITARMTGMLAANAASRSPGMLFQAQRDLNLDLSRTPFVGDDERDRRGGRRGRLPLRPRSLEQRPLIDCVQELINEAATAEGNEA